MEEGLDFLFPFSLEQRQEKTQPEGFLLSKSLALTFRAVLLSRCPPCKTISAIFYLTLSLPLSLSLSLSFRSNSTLASELSSPLSHLRPRDSSDDSRPRRFQSCLVEVSTRPHLALDIPSNLLPFPSSSFLLTPSPRLWLWPPLLVAKRLLTLARVKERMVDVYIDRSERIESRLEGNFRLLPQEIRGTPRTRDTPFHRFVVSLLPIFFFFLSSSFFSQESFT